MVYKARTQVNAFPNHRQQQLTPLPLARQIAGGERGRRERRRQRWVHRPPRGRKEGPRAAGRRPCEARGRRDRARPARSQPAGPGEAGAGRTRHRGGALQGRRAEPDAGKLWLTVTFGSIGRVDVLVGSGVSFADVRS